MKVEDFIRLSLEQIFGIDQSTVDKHFTDFKRDFRSQPNVLNSLKNDAMDKNGIIMDSDLISQDIEKIKSNVLNLNPESMKFLFIHMNSWFNLFIYEIKLQFDFAKESFNKYLLLKKIIPPDTKKIFKEIHHFSIHAANISKLIDRTKTPTNSLRSKLFSVIEDNADLDLRPLRELRNHLEHFEVRLDAWHYLNWGKPILDMNIFDSNTKGIMIEECLRMLDIENDNIFILGQKFELIRLFNIINKIDNVLDDIL